MAGIQTVRPDPTATTSQLLRQIVLAVAVLVCVNILIARMAKNSVPRQVIRAIDANPQATVLAAGNSLMAAGFDADTFRAASRINEPSDSAPLVIPLNIALGSSGTVEHLLLLRRAFLRDKHVNMILYGFFDLQLAEKPTGSWSDLVGNRAMAYYVEPYFAADMYSPGSRLQLIQVGLISHVPMLVERLTLWAKVEKFRRIIGQTGLPKEKTNEFGRASDFTAIEFNDVGRFKNLCDQCVQQRLPFTPSVESMISQTREHGATFVLIEMPMPVQHRAKFYQCQEWKSYQAHIRRLATEKDCPFIDASDWISDEDFADALHLAPAGARLFSDRLARELRSMTKKR